MGRGKFDTCENCIYGTEERDGKYSCKFDKKNEYDADDWCKYHESEDEQN